MVELSSTTKGMMKQALPNLAQLIVIFAMIMVFKPGINTLIALLMFANLVLWVYEAAKAWPKKKKNKDLLIGSASICVVLSLFYLLNHFFGAYGFLGLFFMAIIFVIYKLSRRWKEFILIKHEGERALFGETLKERHERKKEEKLQ